MQKMIIFTDLDGTLLDPSTYSSDEAKPALDKLREENIPLILASSKTRAEIEPIRYRLALSYPFISENGGGIFIPKDYFPFPLESAFVRGDYQVIELGVPYPKIRAALKEVQQAVGFELRGFGDMSAQEIAERTGLSEAEALLARQREYDEPFIILKDANLAIQVTHEIELRGFHCTRGGGFYHLMGGTDKGRACRYLIEGYRRLLRDQVCTLGIGDSLNDLPLLAAVDRPILIQKPDGSHDHNIQLANLIRVPGAGPVGWNRAVLSLWQDG